MMFGSIRDLINRWSSWIGDRDLEILIRKRLTSEGYLGDGGKFHYMRLVAVQRPGWLQVFSFNVSVRQSQSGSDTLLFGLLRQDERYNRTEVRFHQNTSERQRLFDEWSEGLIVTRRNQL